MLINKKIFYRKSNWDQSHFTIYIIILNSSKMFLPLICLFCLNNFNVKYKIKSLKRNTLTFLFYFDTIAVAFFVFEYVFCTDQWGNNVLGILFLIIRNFECAWFLYLSPIRHAYFFDRISIKRSILHWFILIYNDCIYIPISPR